MDRRAFLKEMGRWAVRLGVAGEVLYFGAEARKRWQPRQEAVPLVHSLAYDELIHPAPGKPAVEALYQHLTPFVEHPKGREILVRVKEYAQLSGIPVDLAVSILAHETGGKYWKPSSKGAQPPMHVMPSTARTLENRVRIGAPQYKMFEEAWGERRVHLEDLVNTLSNPALLVAYGGSMPVFDPRILPREAQARAVKDRGWKLNPPLVMLNRRFAAYDTPWKGNITDGKENVKASMLYLTQLLVDARDITLRLREDTPSYTFPEEVFLAAYNAGPGVLSAYAKARSGRKVRDEHAFARAWLRNAYPGQPFVYAERVSALLRVFREKDDWQAWLESIPPSRAVVAERLEHG